MSAHKNSNPGRSEPRVLLIHPEDRYPAPGSPGPWDLIVDFGHAAPATHDNWSRQAGCRVLSLFDFSEDVDDLYRARDLIQSAGGRLVDSFGIDWWDVLSVMITPDLLSLLMVQRLAAELPRPCVLYMSRPIAGAQALARMLGAPLHNLESSLGAARRRARQYFHVVSRFDPAMTLQIFQDKFDRTHALRKKLARRRRASGRPVVLLPTAYANVSRTGASLAAALPEDEFLLVYTRAIAKLQSLPANVQSCSLDPYFAASDPEEIASLLAAWPALSKYMNSAFAEWAAAEAAGSLGRIPFLLPWGIAMRDAWTNLLDAENVVACLSADDGNPYTRLPLILAKKRGLPAVACHHGALDYGMAIKTNYADSYLAKSEMERDYLVNVCHVTPEVIVPAPAPWPPVKGEPEAAISERSWLVFFSESSASPWRGDEIYRDLMPALVALAQRCRLQLVFKLHPFENRKNYEKWIERFLPGESGRRVAVITGPPSAELWNKVRFALTAQSTTAVECHARGIPVFLCAWLRELNCGYQEQFARFGIGRVLQTPEQIAEIPRLLESWKFESPANGGPWGKPHAMKLHDLFAQRAVSHSQGAGD